MGQTVGHAHIHVIPRYAADVPDPRGGIRWVVPARAPYWTPTGRGSEPAMRPVTDPIPSAEDQLEFLRRLSAASPYLSGDTAERGRSRARGGVRRAPGLVM